MQCGAKVLEDRLLEIDTDFDHRAHEFLFDAADIEFSGMGAQTQAVQIQLVIVTTIMPGIPVVFFGFLPRH